MAMPSTDLDFKDDEEIFRLTKTLKIISLDLQKMYRSLYNIMEDLPADLFPLPGEKKIFCNCSMS